MILVLHGENIKDLYGKLQEVKNSQNEAPFVFGKEHSYDDLYMAINSVSLLDEKNFLIAENFFKDKKLKARDKVLENFSKDKLLVIYESAQLTPATATALSKIAKVENFKPEPQIFRFLDSIGPNFRPVVQRLCSMPESEQGSLLWNMTNRFLLLLLARLNYTCAEAVKISGRNMAPWQWQKIAEQSRSFSVDSLKKIYQGMLKIDYMIKTGQTGLPPKTLVSYLLLKYLKV